MRRTVGLLLFAAILLSLAGCGFQLSIAGTIHGSDGSTLIFDASITAVSEAGQVFEARSGMDGRYLLHVPAGTYQMTIERFSFTTARAEVRVTNRPFNKDFYLSTGFRNDLDIPWLSFLAETLPEEFDFRSARAVEPATFRCSVDLMGSHNPSKGEHTHGIRFYRSDSGTGPFVLIAAVPFSSTEIPPRARFRDEDPSFVPGRTVYYAVSSWSSEGESLLSPVRPITFMPGLTLASPAPGAVLTEVTPTFRVTPISVPGETANYFFYVYEWKYDNYWELKWESGQTLATAMPYGDRMDTPEVDVMTLESGKTYRWRADAVLPDRGARAYSFSRTFTTP